MRFKQVSINERKSTYSSQQNKALGAIANKLNEVSEFFDKINQLENLILKNIYSEYIRLIKIRENREEIEKIGGKQVYIKDYFLKAVEEINLKLKASENEWNDLNKDYSLDLIRKKIKRLKTMKNKIKECCSNGDTMKDVLDVIDIFGQFKVYKTITIENPKEKVEHLLSLDEIFSSIEGMESVANTVKEDLNSGALSIDDL